MGDGGGGDGGSTIMGGGGGGCVGSGRVNEMDCCRLLGVIQELWEDLPYNFPFFLEFLYDEGEGRRGWGAGVDDVSCVRSQRSMSSISSLVSILKVSSVTFVFVEGS